MRSRVYVTVRRPCSFLIHRGILEELGNSKVKVAVMLTWPRGSRTRQGPSVHLDKTKDYTFKAKDRTKDLRQEAKDRTKE